MCRTRGERRARARDQSRQPAFLVVFDVLLPVLLAVLIHPSWVLVLLLQQERSWKKQVLPLKTSICMKQMKHLLLSLSL